jgi:hypothetical protein
MAPLLRVAGAGGVQQLKCWLGQVEDPAAQLRSELGSPGSVVGVRAFVDPP